MALDLKKIQARKAAAKVGGGGVWTPNKPGRNVIRLFDYVSTTTEDEEIDRIVAQHFENNRPAGICGRSPAPDGTVKAACDRCTHADEIAEEEGSDEKAKDFRAKESHLVQGVVLVEKDVEQAGPFHVRKMMLPPSVFKAIMDAAEDLMQDGMEMKDVFGVNGINFRIKFDKSARPMYAIQALQKTVSKPLPKSLLAEVKDLHSDPWWNPEWYNAAHGLKRESAPAKTAAGGDEDDAPAPAAAKPKARRPAPAPVEEEPVAEEEEVVEEPEEAPAPAPRPKAKAKAKPAPAEEEFVPAEPGDEDVLDEPEEPAPKPRAKAKAKPAPEPAEEEEVAEEAADEPEEAATEDVADGSDFDPKVGSDGKPLPKGFERAFDPASGSYFLTMPKPEGWKKKDPPSGWEDDAETQAALKAARIAAKKAEVPAAKRPTAKRAAAPPASPEDE